MSRCRKIPKWRKAGCESHCASDKRLADQIGCWRERLLHRSVPHINHDIGYRISSANVQPKTMPRRLGAWPLGNSTNVSPLGPKSMAASDVKKVYKRKLEAMSMRHFLRGTLWQLHFRLMQTSYAADDRLLPQCLVQQQLREARSKMKHQGGCLTS